MSYLQPQEIQQGLERSYKKAVRAASTANLNLAATHTAVDGVTLADLDRVLLKDQSTASENGIYVWSSGTQMFTRARDGLAFESGCLVAVQEGGTHGDQQWQLDTNNPIVVGSTSLTFSQTSGGGGGGGGFGQAQVQLANSDEVNGTVGTKVSAAIPFDTTEWTGATTFTFGVVMSATSGQQADVVLYNLTDGENVTGTSLSTTNTAPTILESAALTVGSAAGNLQDSQKIYEVRITTDGTISSERTFLGSAWMRVAS